MSISSLKNRINKRIELEKFKSDFTDIGSFIKKKRKELNVTQDEISTGICSISYLSKIENNQIIPNDLEEKAKDKTINVSLEQIEQDAMQELRRYVKAKTSRPKRRGAAKGYGKQRRNKGGLI